LKFSPLPKYYNIFYWILWLYGDSTMFSSSTSVDSSLILMGPGRLLINAIPRSKSTMNEKYLLDLSIACFLDNLVIKNNFNGEAYTYIYMYIYIYIYIYMAQIKVVKIAFWLVKSYDFTSQNMHYGLNRLKKSKMGKIELKSQKSDEIAQNHNFRIDLAILTKWGPETKSPPPGQLSDAYWIIPTQSRTHVTVFTLLFPIEAKNSFTNHNSQILFPIPTEQIPNRAATTIYSPSSTKAAITPHFTPKKERKKKTERDWQKERGLMNLPRSEDSRTEGLRWEWNQQRENLEQRAPID